MKSSNSYLFALGIIMLFGVSTVFFSDLAFAETDVPDPPVGLEAKAVSSTKIDLSWNAPDDDKSDNNAAVTGYKIETKKIPDSRYDVIVEDTKSKSTKYSHTGLDEDANYVYRVSAINSEGESDESSEAVAKTLSSDDDNTSQQDTSSTSDNTSQQDTSSTSDNTSQQDTSSTSDNTSQQDTSSTSDNTSQQDTSSTSDNTSQQDTSSTSDNTSQQDTSSTSDNTSQQDTSSTSDNITSINDVKIASIQAFSNMVDPEIDPQYYVDRYNNESAYRNWFDRNFSEITIYEALGMEKPDAEPTTAEPTTAEPTTAEPTTAEPTTAEPTTAEPTTAEPTTAEPTTAEPTTAEPTTAEPTTAEPTTAEPTTAEPTTAEPTTAEPTTAEPTTAEPTTAEPTTAEPTTAEPTTAEPTTAEFVDPNLDPQYYVDKYNNESDYKDWFDGNYPQYSSIYQAVGLDDPAEVTDENEMDSINCEPGTEQVGDTCVTLKIQEKPWWQFW